MADQKFSRGDSKKKLAGDVRRNRFKDRGKDLERGVSTPALFSVGAAAPKAPLPLNEDEVVTVGQGMGHQFVKKTFFHAAHCQHCSEILWGIRGQGYICEVCNYITHEKCVSFLKTPCRHVMADAIQSPVAHKWMPPEHVKRKIFCNICRKKICGECVVCQVCKLYSHKSCKRNNFNNCKACATYEFGAKAINQHHWIEGNLPSTARCQICNKSCASTDCLTGFRCGWCGVEVHSSCLDLYQNQSDYCTFRDLWGMVLIPSSISHRSVTLSEQEANTPGASRDSSIAQGLGEDEDNDGEDDTDGGKGKPVLVVDGSSDENFKKWRKHTMHPTYIGKNVTAQELLCISLRKCGISDDPTDYYLVEVLDSKNGVERELAPEETPYNIQTKGILRLHIRNEHVHLKIKKDVNEVQGNMRINNGQLSSAIQEVFVLVNNSTTVSEIITNALRKFNMENELPDDFCFVEVSQVKGVRENVLANTDTPWKSIQELRKNSLTLYSRQRYYLRNRKGGNTSIFLSMSKEILRDRTSYIQFVRKLMSEAPEDLVSSLDLVEVGPSFPTLGGLIITFPSFPVAVRLIVTMEQSPNLPKITMLPALFPEVLAIDQEPVLVFINSKSGGNQGVELISAFRRHLNPHQVWDLSKGGPVPGLWTFRNLKQFRILIGGGDGTFGWVLGALQEMKEHLMCKEPPSALLPLGTGNDLARALKWGGGYMGEKVMQLLLTLEDANITKLDRWNVSLKTQQLSVDAGNSAASTEPPTSIVMNNYMGVGLDAAIALDFHLAREENPEKFSSRLHNKSFYLQLGLQKMVTKNEKRELRQYVTLTVDEKCVNIPDIAGLIILNIQSWGAGADPWGTTSDSRYKPTAYDDGFMEVVGIKGVMQMGQVQSGIRNAVRIAQGSKFVISLLSDLPVQVDGEAWAQPPGVITITKLLDSSIMLQGPDKASINFSRSLSKKEVSNTASLLHSVSNSGIDFNTGLSSRRELSKDFS